MKSFRFVRNIPPMMTVCFFSEGFLMTSCCETLNLSRCAVPPRKKAVDLILTSNKKRKKKSIHHEADFWGGKKQESIFVVFLLT